MIAADDDGRFDFARADQIVEEEPDLGSVAIAEPTNARGQTLVGHPRARELDPSNEIGVVAHRAEDHLVGRRDVGRVPGERRPAEGALAAAEQRSDVGWHETRYVERAFGA